MAAGQLRDAGHIVALLVALDDDAELTLAGSSHGDGMAENHPGCNTSERERSPALHAFNDALERFAALDAPKAELVKLRYFVGLTTEQAACVLNISEPTAKRWWAYAKAWLFRELREDGG
ncbi:MAG: hypothetical protein KIT22_12265 [Verrucomicrobiae bacterium]|nr:hypothetical protein [Verrucomicrobiae bacterium]